MATTTATMVNDAVGNVAARHVQFKDMPVQWLTACKLKALQNGFDKPKNGMEDPTGSKAEATINITFDHYQKKFRPRTAKMSQGHHEQ